MGEKSEFRTSFNDKTTVKDNISSENNKNEETIVPEENNVKSVARKCDKIILKKRRKIRNVKLKVDGNKFGIKASRPALESRLVCKESHLLIYLGLK